MSGSHNPLNTPRSSSEEIRQLRANQARLEAELAALQNGRTLHVLAACEQIFEQATDGFASFDADFRALYVSSSAARLARKDKEELAGRTLWEIYPPLSGGEIERRLRQVMTGRVADVFDHYSTGFRTWFELRVSPTAWGGINLWVRDISERVKAEQARREEDEVHARQLKELENIYSGAPVGLCVLDSQLRYLRINQALAAINGLPVEDHIGRTLGEALPALAPQLEPVLRSVLESGNPRLNIEIQGATPSQPGVQRTWLANYYPLLGADGRILGVNAVVQEITAIRREQEALRQSKQELKEAQRLAKVGSWSWDLETGAIQWSEELYHMSGIDPSEPIGGFEQIRRFFSNEQLPSLDAAVERARRDGTPYDFETEVTLPGGRRTWRWVRFEGQRDGSGRIVKLRGTSQDITERKQFEESLRRAKQELKEAQRVAKVGSWTLDVETRTLTWSEELYRLHQRDPWLPAPTPDQLSRYFTPASWERLCPSREEVMRNGGSFELELEIVRADAQQLWICARGEAVRDSSGRIVQLRGTSQDITERIRSEQQTRSLATVVEQATEAVVITDLDGVIRYCNPAFQRITGYTISEVLGQNPRILKSGKQDPEFYRQLWSTLAAGKPWVGTFTNRKKDGTLYQEEATISPIQNASGKVTGYAAVKRDVTERVNLENQLRQSQKLESLGRLAGGVAHDFNNLLTVINGYSDMLACQLHEGDPASKWAGEIRQAGERAAALTRQLLAFGRKQIIEARPLDFNQLILQNRDMLLRVLGEDIEIRTQLDSGLGSVLADPGQLSQILMNLVVNARDAMPRGGVLTIATSNHELDEAAAARAGISPGLYVRAAVTDTGEGIDPQIQARIFDPFFTTKPEGKGTGLGLATVYGIIRQSGGTIEVHSEPGRGASFEFLLPQIQEAPAPEQPVPIARDALRGTETILVVEDQDAVRKLVVHTLRTHGYRILEAAGGSEALLLTSRQQQSVQLLVTDVVMPGITGVDLAESLAIHWPEMKVLYMSGYAEDAMMSRGMLKPGSSYLAKPFAPSALAAKVRRLLDPAPLAKSILIVDDEDGIRDLFREILQGAGFLVKVAESGRQALRMAREQSFDLVLTDLVMEDGEGIETIQSLRKEHADLKIIAMSGAFGGSMLKVAETLGANAGFGKPISQDRLIEAVRAAL
jgi:PAS domain S-box-containing protein